MISLQKEKTHVVESRSFTGNGNRYNDPTRLFHAAILLYYDFNINNNTFF